MLDASTQRVVSRFARFLRGRPPLTDSSRLFDFVAKVDRVVSHFGPDGVAREEYVRAAAREPRLFVQNPDRIIAKLESMERYCTSHGLGRGAYVHAVLSRSPNLATYRPDTLMSHVETVVGHFAPHGLDHEQFLRAAVRQPTLFYQNPGTAIGNIEEVVRHFAGDGLTCEAYLRAAIQQPTLFYQKPKTIIGHINLTSSILNDNQCKLGVPEALRLMLRNPKTFALSDDNLAMRTVYSAQTLNTSTSAIVNKNRAWVEGELKRTLGHDGQPPAIPKSPPEEGPGPHARNLLLRALVHEGWLKGRLV